MNDMSKQMGSLDDFVAKARSHNGHFHDAQLGSLDSMALSVRDSSSTIQGQLEGISQRVRQLQKDVSIHAKDLEQSTAPLNDDVRNPLSELRANIQRNAMKEYRPTGVTPQKRRYEYPTTLPRTDSHDDIRYRPRNSKQITTLSSDEETQLPCVPSSPVASPSSKAFVYSDAVEEVDIDPPPLSAITSSNTGLREVNVNVARPILLDAGDDALLPRQPEAPTPIHSTDLDETPHRDETEHPPLKRRRSTVNHIVISDSKLPQKKLSKRMASMMEGRENVPPPAIPGGRRFHGKHPSS